MGTNGWKEGKITNHKSGTCAASIKNQLAMKYCGCYFFFLPFCSFPEQLKTTLSLVHTSLHTPRKELWYGVLYHFWRHNQHLDRSCFLWLSCMKEMTLLCSKKQKACEAEILGILTSIVHPITSWASAFKMVCIASCCLLHV